MTCSLKHACVATLLAAGSCGQQAGLGELSRVAEPHLQDFARFETWTLRALAAVEPTADSDSRAETVFAPVRNKSDVLFAQVVIKEGARQRALDFPDHAQLDSIEDAAWRRIAKPQLPKLGVLRAPRCPVSAPAWWRDGKADGPCVLLSHQTSWGDRSTLEITMAFRATDSP